MRVSTLELRPRRGWILASVFALALALRCWGITWGMPARFDLNPDETNHVMGTALDLSFTDPDPHFLNYPTFTMYVVAITNGALRRLGVVDETWHAFLIGRFYSALNGAATAAVAVLLAEELGAGLAGATLAGFWVALLPLHVWESHFTVTDIPMSFWLLVALWLSVRLARLGRWEDYALAGIAIGLAIGSKYTAAIVVIAPVVAVLGSGRPILEGIGGLVVAGAAAFVACFAVTPYSFLHLRDTLSAMAYENWHVHSFHYGWSLPADGAQYHKYVYQLVAAWPFSLGFALYASAAAGTIWAARRMDLRLFAVFAFAVVFFAVTGSWTYTPIRYYLPLVILGAIFAGMWQGSWLGSPRERLRATAAAAIVITAIYTAAFTGTTTARFSHDTRIRAARWLDGSLHDGDDLVLLGMHNYHAMPSNPAVRVEVKDEMALRTPGKLGRTELLAVSSLYYDRHLRHRDRQPLPQRGYDLLRRGNDGWTLVRRFEDGFLNRGLYARLDPMFAGYFVSPTLEFYARGEMAVRLTDNQAVSLR